MFHNIARPPAEHPQRRSAEIGKKLITKKIRQLSSCPSQNRNGTDETPLLVFYA
jgi:hypothetical protein